MPVYNAGYINNIARDIDPLKEWSTSAWRHRTTSMDTIITSSLLLNLQTGLHAQWVYLSAFYTRRLLNQVRTSWYYIAERNLSYLLFIVRNNYLYRRTNKFSWVPSAIAVYTSIYIAYWEWNSDMRFIQCSWRQQIHFIVWFKMEQPQNNIELHNSTLCM